MQILKNTWIFIKSTKWHLLLTPVYAYIGIWYTNMAVLIASVFSGRRWCFRVHYGVFGEVTPQSYSDLGFLCWLSSTCLAVAIAGYILARCIALRLAWLRRSLAICLIILPVAVVLQALHIIYIANRNIYLALWIPTVVYSMILIFLVVHELVRNEKNLKLFRYKIAPAIIITVAIIFCLLLTNQNSWLWYMRERIHIALTNGPISAEIFRHQRKIEYAKSESELTILHKKHYSRLCKLVEKHPTDPAVDEAYFKLGNIAYCINKNSTDAIRWLKNVKETCEASLWARSRYILSDIYEKAEPEDLNSALYELNRINCKELPSIHWSIPVYKKRIEILQKLGRKDEACEVAQQAISAIDERCLQKGVPPERYSDDKAEILLEVGRIEEAEKAMLEYIKSRPEKVEAPEVKARRMVSGLVLMRDPVGKEAPELKGVDTKGKEVNLEHLSGKYVLVDFWATWCGPCIEELPHFLEAHKELHSNGVVFLGVSTDREREDLLKVIAENNVPWQMLYEGDNEKISEVWGVTAIPHSFLVDPEGKIAAHGIRGPDIAKQVLSIIQSKENPAAQMQ